MAEVTKINFKGTVLDIRDANAARASDLAAKANTADVYTKSEVDTKVAEAGSDAVSVTTNQDGTFVIHVGETDYTINLNHTHENMAKLIVCEESDLPSTLAKDTIYAQVNDADNPTEIETLYICGLEFAGGGVPAGTPAITRPSGTTINLGENSGSGVSKAVEIKANSHITGDLTVGLAANSDLSFDTTNLPSGVTYNSGAGTLTIAQVTAMQGVNITIVYSGSGGAEIDGGLIITGGGASPKSVVVVVVEPPISAIKLTGSQWLKTDYYPNALTELELECKFAINENSYSFASDIGRVFLVSKTSNSKYFYHMIARKTDTATTIVESLVEGDSSDMVILVPATSFFADHSVYKYEVGTNNNTIKWIVNGSEVASKSISKKTTTMPDPLLIGYATNNDTIFSFFDLTIYRLTIKENGVNVRNYVPKSVGGVPGLYDTITDTFISSETSTEVETITETE